MLPFPCIVWVTSTCMIRFCFRIGLCDECSICCIIIISMSSRYGRLYDISASKPGVRQYLFPSTYKISPSSSPPIPTTLSPIPRSPSFVSNKPNVLSVWLYARGLLALFTLLSSSGGFDQRR